MESQTYVTTVRGDRRFACSPAAVLAFIINEREEILLLAHPKRGGAWEVVNGALEAGETVLDCALRETHEEAGPALQVRPLGAFHIGTFHYDENVRYLLSINYLLAYQGGTVQPGDDMAGSQYCWWRVSDITPEKCSLVVPTDQHWLFNRALELYRLWKDQEVLLQPNLEGPTPLRKAK